MADPRHHPDFFEKLVEGSHELVCTFDRSGTIDYANPGARIVLGWEPEEMVGRNVVDLLHPDDLARAAAGMGATAERGAPVGTTSFRVRCKDGSFADVDLSVGNVALDEEDEGGTRVSVFCRPADYQHAIDALLHNLLDGGASAAETFEPVLDVFAWKPNGSQVAIAWWEPKLGHQAVSTGLPVALTGAEAEPGEPWARARSTGEQVDVKSPDDLDDQRAAAARANGRGPAWIVPVDDPNTGVRVLVTVFARADGGLARGHEYGMSVAERVVTLILRWRLQIQRLEEAAYHDPLTGLGNRQVVFDVLADEQPAGALLYCDLDRFKPVNDEHGHAVGDDLLRRVATRLRSCVRAEDLLARLGGDEFVVLCRGASVEQAAELVERITAVFEEPFDVAGTEVSIGISIGVAHADGISEETLDAADRDLYRVKARRRPT